MTVEKSIHEIELDNDVDQIKKLTKNKLVHIDIVSPDVSDDVIDYNMSPSICRLSFCIKTLSTQILEQQL